MANYLLVYKGGKMETSPEGQAAQMAAWGAWFGGLGGAVVDGGNPCGPSKTVASSGAVSDGGASGISGYSVLKADTLEVAATMAKGCPVLKAGGNVEVYETFNAM